MTTEEAAFVAAIEADPLNFTARLVYADWLQDHEDDRWRFQAAIGHHRLMPMPEFTMVNQHKKELRIVTWFRNGVDGESDYEKYGLPVAWFECLPKRERVKKTKVGPCYYVSYYGRNSFNLAYAEAATAWDVMPPELQNQILADAGAAVWQTSS